MGESQIGELPNDIIWNGTCYVLAGANGIFSSTDGDHWRQTYYTSGTGMMKAAYWDGNRFIAIGTDGIILTSADGFNWQKQFATDPKWHFNDIAWNGSTYIVVGVWGKIVISTDATTWIEINSPTQSYLEDVIWDGRQFVAVG